MTDCECGGGSCILCKVIDLLDKAGELEGGDFDKGLELILFAAGSLPATVEGYTWPKVEERVRRAYSATALDLVNEARASLGEPPRAH